MARRHASREQRTLLQPHEATSAVVTHDFRATHSLSQALTAEKKLATTKHSLYLKEREKTMAYVEKARTQPPPPLKSVVKRQTQLSELRRETIADVGVASPETKEQNERRLVRQGAFVASRKCRHDDACEGFERRMDELAEQSQASTQDRILQMRKYMKDTDLQIEQLLSQLEGGVDDLGKWDETQVRGVLTSAENVSEARRVVISNFTADLEVIESRQRDESGKELQQLNEKLTSAAHVVPGEIERIIEQKTLDLNAVMVENQSSVKTLGTKLLIQTLEKSKDAKKRWHEGLLLWKRRRHHHSLGVGRDRVAGSEFRQPDVLLEILERVREQQNHACKLRTALAETLFSTAPKNLSAALVQECDDRNVAVDKRSQETFDVLTTELQECADHLDKQGEAMIKEVCEELVHYDARLEWGEHDSVEAIVEAEIKPGLRDCHEYVHNMTRTIATTWGDEEERQEDGMKSLLRFYKSLAEKQFQLKKDVERLPEEHECEVEGMEKEHQDACEERERELSSIKDDMMQEARLDQLDLHRERAFEQLGIIEQAYRDHTDSLITQHEGYPRTVAKFMEDACEGFCRLLGLTTEAAVEAAAAAAADAEGGAPAATHETAGVDLADLQEWSQGADTGCRILEQIPLPKLKEEVLKKEPKQESKEFPAVAQESEPPSPRPATKAAAKAVAKANAKGAKDVPPEPPPESEEEKAPEEPQFLDCPAAAEAIQFRAPWLQEPLWLEQRLGSTREAVFQQLASCRKRLHAGVDIEARCDEARRNLSTTISRHTRRKGEVQVDWYAPRQSTISKHKDKFQRHLVEIARKSQADDEQFTKLLAEFEAAETQYQESLTNITERLGGAGALATLTALQKEGADAAKKFKAEGERIRDQLLNLATNAPEALKSQNDSFFENRQKLKAWAMKREQNKQNENRQKLKDWAMNREQNKQNKAEKAEQAEQLCEKGDEQKEGDKYGRKEIEYYQGQIKELNQQLDLRAKDRNKQARELEALMEEKQIGPLEEFKSQYETVENTLCETQGLGRQHGEPRRKARSAYRGIVANVDSVKQHILVLIEYFTALCELSVDSAVPPSGLPADALFRVCNCFPPDCRGGWVFTAELLGVLDAIVCSVAAAGTHVGAFKETRAGLFRLEDFQPVRLLCEQEAVCAPEDLDAEIRLRKQCLTPVLGPMLRVGTADTEVKLSDPLGAEVEAIAKQANDVYAGKGGTPQFMVDFLGEMRQAADQQCQEAARELRVYSDTLRQEVLLRLGEALFGELGSRSILELKQLLAEVQAGTAAEWATLDSRRAAHEKRLGHGLAGPNSEAALRELVTMEADRYGEAIKLSRQDRSKTAVCLRGLASGFVRRMAARFELAMRLVDRLPLHAHYRQLPGDENEEVPRPSIKRRMRQLQTGVMADLSGETLPEKYWQGLPLNELRAALLPADKEGNATSSASWPPDYELSGLAPEALETDLMPAVASFRSPVHRRLFEARNMHYQRYKAEFLREVGCRRDALAMREEREQAGQQRWKTMIRQVQGGAGPVEALDVEVRQETPEPPPPSAPAAKAPPTKEKPKAKAKK